jgi:hypothetical protein
MGIGRSVQVSQRHCLKAAVTADTVAVACQFGLCYMRRPIARRVQDDAVGAYVPRDMFALGRGETGAIACPLVRLL